MFFAKARTLKRRFHMKAKKPTKQTAVAPKLMIQLPLLKPAAT